MTPPPTEDKGIVTAIRQIVEDHASLVLTILIIVVIIDNLIGGFFLLRYFSLF
jgi:hypothetical protein